MLDDGGLAIVEFLGEELYLGMIRLQSLLQVLLVALVLPLHYSLFGPLKPLDCHVFCLFVVQVPQGHARIQQIVVDRVLLAAARIMVGSVGMEFGFASRFLLGAFISL